MYGFEGAVCSYVWDVMAVVGKGQYLVIRVLGKGLCCESGKLCFVDVGEFCGSCVWKFCVAGV